MTVAGRRRSERFGRRAEALCRWRLRLTGWRILARNWRLPVGEIDIIARRRDLIAFIEVKARHDIGDAEPTARQRKRIARAAAAYLGQHPALAACDCRFDIMVVRARAAVPLAWPTRIAGAWRADEV